MKQLRLSYRKTFSGLGLLLLLTGCAGTDTISFSAQGSHNLNLDSQSHALSLVTHVIQLKSDQAFNRLTTADLISGKTESQLLGDDFISSQELVLVPGKTGNIDATLDPSARYVGVIAYFNNPDPYFWRLLYNAHSVSSKGLKILAERCSLKPVAPARLPIPGQPRSYAAHCTGSTQ